jgi:hypothetical protein
MTKISPKPGQQNMLYLSTKYMIAQLNNGSGMNMMELSITTEINTITFKTIMENYK